MITFVSFILFSVFMQNLSLNVVIKNGRKHGKKLTKHRDQFHARREMYIQFCGSETCYANLLNSLSPPSQNKFLSFHVIFRENYFLPQVLETKKCLTLQLFLVQTVNGNFLPRLSEMWFTWFSRLCRWWPGLTPGDHGHHFHPFLYLFVLSSDPTSDIHFNLELCHKTSVIGVC